MIIADVVISTQAVYAVLIFAGLIYLVRHGVVPLKIEIGNWFSTEFRETRAPSKRLKRIGNRTNEQIKKLDEVK